MGKSQNSEQDFFTQNHVQNFNNFFARIRKKTSSEIEPNNKTELPPKTSNYFFSAKLPRKCMIFLQPFWNNYFIDA